MKKPNNRFISLLHKFSQFHKREVKQFNAILGIKQGSTSGKC